ncbi:MAG: TetR/AcrR family transcriptional regulator [Proteobacteria bacterium]|nr:TetR/AcrR family transcriptional regulator [Pseudomonadota bacterium]
MTLDGEERGSRAEKKAQSRRKILESARDVFFRDGFMAANLDEVAERAGVAKGTLYRYFESKADLYVAVLADNGRVFLEKMSEAASGSGSAVERLERLSGFYLEHWTRHREYFQIFWAIDNQPVIGELPDAVVSEVTRLWEQSLSVLNRVLEQGVEEGSFRPCDTWEVANLLWTLANGLIQSEQTGARRALRRRPLEEVYQDGIGLLLRGLSSAPG